MIPDYLIVTNVSDNKVDKNNREYKVITLTTPEYHHCIDKFQKLTLALKAEKQYAKLTAWKEPYVSEHEDFGYSLQLEDKILGSIVTMQVEPYSINERIVEQYTTIVLGDSTKSN